MRLILLSFVAAIIQVAAFAQTTITGRVIDNYTKQPLIGANVVVPNTTIGTTTDEKGEFSLSTGTRIEQLRISYVGYRTVTVPVDEKTSRLNILLEATQVLLSEVTVVGYETNRKLIETAGSISMLTAEQIRRYDNSSILPALNTIPGVRMESQMPGGSSRLSIRGSLLRSPFGVRGIKAYWNDIPMTGAGGNTNYDLFEPSVIGNIEVLKGPAGSIYGAGTGGVMILSAARASYGDRSVGLGVQSGSFGLRRSGVSLNSGLQDANLSLSYADQYYRGYREKQSSTYRKLLSANAIFFPSENRTVSALLLHADAEFQSPGALTKAEYDANPRQVLPAVPTLDPRVTRKSTSVGISHQYDISEAVSNITSAYSLFADVDHPYGTSQFNSGYFRSTYSSYGGRTRFVWKPELFSFKSRITAGGEYQRDVTTEKEYANVNGKPGNMMVDTDVTTVQYILFAQAELELTQELLLTLGMSYNKLHYDVLDLFNPPGDPDQSASVSFSPKLVPRVALVYKMSSTLALHASISQGFGPPTNSEISTAVTGQINANLTPETGTNYEIGMRGTALNNRLNFYLSAFQFLLDNIIISRTLAGGKLTYENSGSANQKGVEAAILYFAINDPQATVSLVKPFVSYTYHNFRFGTFIRRNDANPAQTQDFSGKKIPGISPLVLVVGLDATTNFGAYTHWTFSYYDKRYITNANDVDISAYRLLSGKAGWRTRVLSAFELDAFAGVENALSTKYVSFLAINAFGGRYYHPAPARSFYGGFSLKYVM
jgi:iron complex outermembrane receptor protein